MKPILIAALAVLLLVGAKQACAAQLWNWSLTGAGVSASGTFTTEATPDVRSFYRITGITGTANGGTITGLQAADTAVPGNSGYPVDNLVSSNGPQLTTHGFGFAVSNGEYHNPFYHEDYLDYVARPPYADGAGAEPAVHFTAALVP